MDNPTIAPEPQKTRRHTGNKILKIIGFILGFFMLGWLVTMVLARPDSNVTDAEREGVASRVNDMKYLDLQGKFFVKQKVVKKLGTDTSRRPVQVYEVENYTLFGIRIRTYELDCWEARPGIDGEITSGGIEPIGSLKNGVWCDGLLF